MRYAPERWGERWARELPQRMFSVGGITGTTAAAINEFLFQLWNPHASRSLWIAEIKLDKTATQAAETGPALVRTSTIGTTGTTITPDLDNDFEREVTPDTGAVLKMASFSVEPTPQSPALSRVNWHVGAPAEDSLWWIFPEGIRVPPGTGLGLVTTIAAAFSNNAVSVRFWE